MIRRLIILLLIVGCGETTEPEITGWVCKLRTECWSSTYQTIIDCPLPATMLDTTTIYSSLEECESTGCKPREFYCEETN